MTVRARFWGTRGSIPSPGPRTVRYGGNTPCVELSLGSGGHLILDAGTGIRELGRALSLRQGGAPLEADVLVSHPHWDHLQGLPFFAPIYEEGTRLTLWSAPSLVDTVYRAIRDLMAPGYFPVAFEDLPARVECRALAEHRLHDDQRTVDAIPVRHPGGALGYRVRDPAGGGALVYISDNELGDTDAYRDAPGWRDELVEFVSGASVLVHDAMYTANECEAHRGWGHSCVEDVVALARESGVPRLVLFHHDPARSDDDVDAMLERARSLAGDSVDVQAAAEGTEMTV